MQEIRDACTYVPKVEVTFRGQTLRLPANLLFRIYLPAKDDPRRESQHYPPVLAGLKNLGFCKEDVTDRGDVSFVKIKDGSAALVAEDLDLASFATINRLSFGTERMNIWLGPPTPKVTEGDPSHLRQTRSELYGPNVWQFAQTRGYLASGYHMSSWCADFTLRDEIFCNLRLTHRDGRVFEVWHFKVATMPEIDASPPPIFMEMMERLPAVVSLFTQDDPK